MMRTFWLVLVVLTAWPSLGVVCIEGSEPPRYFEAEKQLQESFGPDLAALSPCEITSTLVQMAERLPVGGAIHLPESVPCGLLDFRRVADDVQITGGHSSTVFLGGGQKGIHLLFSRLNQVIDVGVPRPTSARRPILLAALDFQGVEMFDPKVAPQSFLEIG